MRVVKQINIKNRTYYFYNDIINLKNVESKLLKIDKKSYKNIGIYNIGYITIKKIDDYENIHSVYPLYLMIGKAIRHIKEKNESKYLVFDSAVLRSMKLHSENENKEVLKNTLNFGMRLKMRLRP